MAVMLLILTALSFHAMADATQLRFAKIGWKVYVETDPEHFAMSGPLTEGGENLLVSADKEG